MKKSNLSIFMFLLFISFGAHGQITQQKTVPELQVDLEKIDSSIETTRERMKTIGDARFLPELYFILAELLVNKSRYMYTIKRLENKDVPVEELDFSNEKKPKFQAIELYQSLLDKFPTNPDRDKALFFMAHEYRELGDTEKMVQTYQRLTREFPESRYWSESQLILGNHAYDDKKDAILALDLYGQILKRNPDQFTPLARYKSGFAYISQARWKEALMAFEGVLTLDTKIDLSKLPEIYRKTDVRRDALLQMVWPYSELNAKDLQSLGPGKVEPLAYFRGLSPNLVSYQRVLQRLGRRLVIKKRFLESTRVYYALLQVATDLDTRMEATEATYKSMKDSRMPWPIYGFVEEVATTVNMIRHTDLLKEKDKKVALNNFEIFARDVATRLQKRAKTTKSKNDYKVAAYAYKDYIWAFPDSRFRATLQLNLAETYFNMGDFVQAGKNYEQVAGRIRDAKRQKSLYDSALQSFTTALKNQAQLDVLEQSEARTGLRAIGTLFLTRYKNDKAIPEIMFNIGRTYYDERNFDEAVKAFESYLARYSNDKNAQLAADLILDSYNQREDFDGLVAAGNRIMRIKGIAPRIRSNVGEIIKQAQFKKIQVKSEEQGGESYAKNLLQFAEKYKGSNLGEQALYEAFVALKAKKDPEAYAPGETLLLKYGNSKYAKEVVSQMGQMALITADFRRAANYFEAYAQKFQSDPQSRALLQNAAQLREFMGDHREAARNYQTLGNSEGVSRNHFLASDWRSLASSASSVGGVKGSYWQGLALYRQGNRAGARPLLQQASQGRGGSFEENTMSAHALYLIASEALKTYETIQMTPGKENEAVQLKNQNLQALTTQLNQVIQFGNGRWTIAALYGLGKANSEFAAFIKRAPTPSGLTGAQLNQYRAAIQQQASQFEKTAENFFKQCVQSAERFDVFTNFVKGCQTQGRTQVDEAQETRVISRASQVAPTQAGAIRKKLYDDSRNVQLLIQLAQVYSQNRDYSMALAVLNRAAEVSPKTSSVVALMGTQYLFMNDLESAYQRFQAALKLNSRDATALWGLAGLYNAYGYRAKLSRFSGQARASGRPLPPVHPFMSSVR